MFPLEHFTGQRAPSIFFPPSVFLSCAVLNPSTARNQKNKNCSHVAVASRSMAGWLKWHRTENSHLRHLLNRSCGTGFGSDRIWTHLPSMTLTSLPQIVTPGGEKAYLVDIFLRLVDVRQHLLWTCAKAKGHIIVLMQTVRFPCQRDAICWLPHSTAAQ